MKYPILGLLLAAAPPVHAAPSIPRWRAARPRQFFAMLRNQHLIDPEPMHVEPDSVNAFWPARDATLSAFDLNVFAIFAYEAGNPAFRAGRHARPRQAGLRRRRGGPHGDGPQGPAGGRQQGRRRTCRALHDRHRLRGP